MENRTKFDLENRRQKWRHRLLESGDFSPTQIEELESHLSDSMLSLKTAGLADEEAFLVAARRLGHPCDLAEEFSRISTSRNYLGRIFWMIAGYFLIRMALNLGTIGAYLALWLGSGQIGNGFTLGFLTVVLRVMLFSGILWLAVLWLPRMLGRFQDGRWLRLLERPGLVTISLSIAQVVLDGIKNAFQNRVIADIPAAVLGRFLIADQFFYIIPVLVLPVFAFLVARKWSNLRLIGSGPTVLTLGFLLLALPVGCGRQPSPERSQPAATTTATPEQAAGGTPVERCLGDWKAGNKDAAIKSFSTLDFTRPMFSKGTPLGFSESAFADLPAAAREKIGAELLADCEVIKSLSRGIKDAATEAKRTGDTSTSQKYSEQLRQFGEQLTKPSCTKVVQMHGRALKKLADTE
jgi:hypothetical protein